MAGLGGPSAGAVVGAVTLTGVPGVVTGLMPLVGAAALGFLGWTSSNNLIILCCIFIVVIRRLLHDVYWPGLLHHSTGSVLYAAH